MNNIQTGQIVTPKDKVVQNQALTSKKKKFFRLLQSNDQDSLYCATASVSLREELRQRMSAVISDLALATEDVAQNVTKKPRKKQQKVKRSSKSKKTIRHNELLFGLSQTLKAIEPEDSWQRIAMVWFSQSLSINLQNVLQKLCTTRKVPCLAIDLELFRQMFNLSSLSVMAFKSNVFETSSMFHQIYNMARKTFKLNNTCTNLPSNEEQVNINKTNCENHEKSISSSTPAVQVKPDRHSFYTSRNEKRYRDMMEERLAKLHVTSLDTKHQFAQKLAFIELAESNIRVKFPDRLRHSLGSDLVSIEWEHKASNTKETAKRSHHFAKQLFELDQMETKPAKKKTPVAEFYTPKLLKGQLDGHKSTLKRTKKANKAALKNKKLKIK